jgi:hypothetical protein
MQVCPTKLHLGIQLQDRFLVNLSDFSQKVCTPLKLMEDSNWNWFQNL